MPSFDATDSFVAAAHDLFFGLGWNLILPDVCPAELQSLIGRVHQNIEYERQFLGGVTTPVIWLKPWCVFGSASIFAMSASCCTDNVCLAEAESMMPNGVLLGLWTQIGWLMLIRCRRFFRCRYPWRAPMVAATVYKHMSFGEVTTARPWLQPRTILDSVTFRSKDLFRERVKMNEKEREKRKRVTENGSVVCKNREEAFCVLAWQLTKVAAMADMPCFSDALAPLSQSTTIQGQVPPQTTGLRLSYLSLDYFFGVGLSAINFSGGGFCKAAIAEGLAKVLMVISTRNDSGSTLRLQGELISQGQIGRKFSPKHAGATIAGKHRKRISNKRTKNQAKTDKIKNGMKRRGKTKVKSKAKSQRSKPEPILKKC
ncbi:hypothetical protein Tco_1103728 [Tanacetum coccineum]